MYVKYVYLVLPGSRIISCYCSAHAIDFNSTSVMVIPCSSERVNSLLSVFEHIFDHDILKSTVTLVKLGMVQMFFQNTVG